MIKYLNITITDAELDNLIESCMLEYFSVGCEDLVSSIGLALEGFLAEDYEGDNFDRIHQLSGKDGKEFRSLLIEAIYWRALYFGRKFGREYGKLYEQFSYEGNLYGRRFAWLRRQIKHLTQHLKSTLRRFARKFNNS